MAAEPAMWAILLGYHVLEVPLTYRKDITVKCYGGDATRKRKLLDKQNVVIKEIRPFDQMGIP